MRQALRARPGTSTAGGVGSGLVGDSGWPRPGESSSRPSSAPDQSAILDEFTDRWDRGESPRVEDFLDRIAPGSAELAVELIYRQYCLEEADGSSPSPATYLERFAEYGDPLGRLFLLHDAVPGSQLRHWARPAGLDDPDDFPPIEPELPVAGDSIGHFRLIRVLGEGAFARVFLAEQADLEDRQVVVKVTSKPSREPWLLARAGHPHIAEIISQFEVDDGALQLICMPFLGGATLSKVLEEARKRARRPSSGRDLLDILDSVSAAEYPEGRRGRMPRDVVAGTSFERALARMIARLAEALDHAYTRKVAHGDVKPSNILVSADAAPMLLDFNLAQDWAGGGEDEDGGPIDRGGTLPYMAPERLLALASCGGHPSREDAPCEPHRADLYSLGMVLLEALSGRGPTLPDGIRPTRKGRREAVDNFRRAAACLADVRVRTSPRDLIRDEAGDRVPASLRPILEHCLDPDPDRRYRRGRELAADLDLWCADRPPAFADEPAFHAACRSARRLRRPLTAAMIVASVAASVGISVWLGLSAQTIEAWKKLGIERIISIWDAPETRVFNFLRIRASDLGRLSMQPDASSGDSAAPGSLGSKIRPDADSKDMEIATLALRDYRVLAPDDWRGREDVRNLPQADREELELWLMEQAYRYCHELAGRPDSPDDWERALAALDRLTSTSPLTAFARLRDRLERNLSGLESRQNGLGAPSPRKRTGNAQAGSPPPWLDEYVLGVALECEANRPDLSVVEAIDDKAGTPAEKALSHYQKTLALRPDSFWGHYNAARLCQGLGRTLDASSHLDYCILRRPTNPRVRGLLAGLLHKQNRLAEALVECDRAIALDPDFAEYYRTRAFVGANLGRSEEMRSDLHRLEVLSRTIPSGMLRTHFHPDRRNLPEGLRLVTGAGQPGSEAFDGGRALGRRGPIDREDLDTRLVLARAVFGQAKDTDQGLAELRKILAIDPDYLHARIYLADNLLQIGDFDEARRELEKVFNHPGLADFVHENREVVGRFIAISWKYMKRGKPAEALSIARRAVDFAEEVGQHIGHSHYTLARANAMTGRKDPALVSLVADHLGKAFDQHWKGEGFTDWYKQDRTFDPIRAQLDPKIEQVAKGLSHASEVQAALSRSATKVAN